MPKEKQIYFPGVDLAKIVAMLFVVLLHVSGYGLSLSPSVGMSWSYSISRAMVHEMSNKCIDIFAIASGFVGLAVGFKWSRVLNLWTQIFFYSVGITVIMICLGYPVGLKELARSIMPITNNSYWYMTDYFKLILVMPFLNAGMMKLGIARTQKIMIPVVIGTSIISLLLGSRLVGVRSFEWIMVLYMIGASLRMMYDKQGFHCNSVALIVVVVFAVVVSALGTLVAHALPASCVRNLLSGMCFSGYMSPFTMTASIAILMLCLNVRITESSHIKLLRVVASSVLAVYLIHVHPLVWRPLFLPFVGSYKVGSTMEFVVTSLAFSLVVFTLCVLLDKIRLLVFRLTHIKQLIDFLCRSFDQNNNNSI